MIKKATKELAVVLAFIGLLIVIACWLITTRREPPAPPQALFSQNAGVTPCAQCVGDTCANANCNIDCEYGTGWCNSIVRGGGGGGVFNRAEALKVGLEFYDHAAFINFRVIRNNSMMEAAGVPLGSTVTHVNGVYLDNLNDFAAAVLDLRGKKLRLIVQDGSAVEVTLK